MSQASECTHSGAVMNLKVERHTELRKKIGCCAFHFLCTVSRFGERFLWWSVQFGQFLICCSTHGDPVPSHL